jgi:KTSC domain-containing protein
MPSSVIRRFAYCPDSAQLWVEFTTGRRYVYSDVPREVADTFRAAFAKGVYFNTRIRDRYPYREVVHEGGQVQATHS